MKTYMLIATIAISVFAAGLLAVGPMQSVAAADGLTPPPSTTQKYEGDISSNPILKWIDFFVNLLSATVLAGAAVMMAWAGIQYMSARDNAQAVQAAKQKIWNVIIGLLAFFFLYAFVQWLIPGGVF